MTKHYLFFILFFSSAVNAIFEDKLNILFIIDRFPSLIKEHIVNQIVYFIDQGHTISIFAEQEENTGKVSKKVQEYNLINYVSYKKIPENLQDVDIVFTQYGDLGKKYIYLKKLFPHIVFVTCFRGGDLTKADLYSSNQFDELFLLGDLFLPVCAYFRYRLELLGCPERKIVVSYSPIDCMVFKYLNVVVQKDISDKHFVITTISRLTPKKGLFYAMEAIKILLQRGYTATLNIIGEGKYRQRLEEYAKKLGIYDHVNFHGLKTHEEILEILNRTDVFVQVSITIENGLQEGIPNTLKEAMGRGISVVGTYHAGIPEIVIPFVTGLLVPERDAESIVDSILYYRQHPEQKDIIRKNARALIRSQHDIRVVNRKLEEVLLRLKNEQVRVKKSFLIHFAGE